MRPYLGHRGLFVFSTWLQVTGQYIFLLLTQLFSVFRRECACVRPDTLRGSGADSRSFPWGAAPPPAARKQQRLFPTAWLCTQLETERRRVVPIAHTSHTLPAHLVHTLPPRASYTGGGGQLIAVAAAALHVAGDSAQRGPPVRQRGSRNRRRCRFRASPYPSGSFTGWWDGTTRNTHNRHFWNLKVIFYGVSAPVPPGARLLFSRPSMSVRYWADVRTLPWRVKPLHATARNKGTSIQASVTDA